jgi:hypothetical protein
MHRGAPARSSGSWFLQTARLPAAAHQLSSMPIQQQASRQPSLHHRHQSSLRVRAATSEESGGSGAVAAPAAIPTRLNTIPHERSTRQHFYREVVAGVQKALAAGETRVVARCVAIQSEGQLLPRAAPAPWLRRRRAPRLQLWPPPPPPGAYSPSLTLSLTCTASARSWNWCGRWRRRWLPTASESRSACSRRWGRECSRCGAVGGTLACGAQDGAPAQRHARR